MPTLMSYIATLFDALSTVVVISGVTPVFALCLVPMILYYLREQSFFMVRPHEGIGSLCSSHCILILVVLTTLSGMIFRFASDHIP